MSYKNNQTSEKEYNTSSNTYQEVNLFKDFDQKPQDLNSLSSSNAASKNIKQKQFLDNIEQSIIEDDIRQVHNKMQQKETALSKTSGLNTNSTDHGDYMKKTPHEVLKDIEKPSIAEIDERVRNKMEQEEREKKERFKEDPLKDLLTGEHPPLRTEEHPTEQYIYNNTYSSICKTVDNLAKDTLNKLKNSVTKKTCVNKEEPLPERSIEVDESNLSNYRYTYVPSKAIVDPSLTHAEFRLFSMLCSYVKPKTETCFPKKEYLTEGMGVSIASLNKYLKSLQNKGYILEYKSRVSIYRLNFETLEGQKYTATPVPAKAIFDLNLTHAKYRCLAVLCSYADYKTATCYPSNKTIAENLYINKRQVSKYITTLNQLRYLRITRRFNKVKGYQNSNLYQVIFDKFRVIDPHKEMRTEEHPPLRTEEHPTEQYIYNNTYSSIYKDVDNSKQEHLNKNSDNNLSNREFNSRRLAGGEVHSINKSNRDNKKGQTKFITEYMYLPTSRKKHNLTHVTNPYKTGYLGGEYLSYTENMDRHMWKEINRMAGRDFCYNSTNRIIKSVIARKIKNNKSLPVFNNLLSLKQYLAKILKAEKRQEDAVNDNLHWAPTSLIKFWEQEKVI